MNSYNSLNAFFSSSLFLTPLLRNMPHNCCIEGIRFIYIKNEMGIIHLKLTPPHKLLHKKVYGIKTVTIPHFRHELSFEML